MDQEIIKDELNYNGKIVFPEHPESHAASFYPSPFQNAAYYYGWCWRMVYFSFGVGIDNKGNYWQIFNLHSLGLLSAFTITRVLRLIPVNIK